MNRAISWFAGHPVASNLLMVVILGAGLFTAFQLKQEVFPEFSLDVITVSVEYLGASPEEVEEAINIRVEEAIQGIEGVRELNSVANEGFGVTTVELEIGSDSAKILDDIKSRVDAIDTFPAEAEKPVYTELTNRRQVIDVAISGPADEHTLRLLAEQVRDELAALPEISLVELSSARPYEISVELSEEAMRRYGLTFDEVAAAIRSSSLDLPAGSVKTRGGEVLLRTKGQAYRGPQFADLVIRTRPDGTQLRLGDVARVVDGFEETDQEADFDGHPAVGVKVFRTGEEKPLQVARAVRDYIRDAQTRMPEGIQLTPWLDASKILRDRLSLLTRNGLQGFALVFLILALFLRFRLAMWVSLGIPISFLGAIWMMPHLDVSINLLSLFAFIVVLGIVVDDAIVVGENIHRHQRKLGHPGLAGSVAGAGEVSTPVVFAVLTTIAAFAPLIVVPGVMGKIMRVIPLIVIPTLVFSLVESLFILPAHLSHGHGPLPKDAAVGPWVRFQRRFAALQERFVERVYRPSLEWCLEWRYLTVAMGIATLLLTLGLAVGGYVRFTFLPSVESEYISAALTMPLGTPAEVTRDALDQLQDGAFRLQSELDGNGDRGVFRHVYASLGEQPYRTEQSANAGGRRQRYVGSHLAEVTIELAPSEERSLGSEGLVQRWRELTGPIPDVIDASFSASLFSAGEDINVQLTGPNLEKLQQAAAMLKQRLGGYAGVQDITDSFREGKREIKLSILPAAEIYGLRLADVARQVRQGFYGEEVQRVQRGRDDVRVMLRYPEVERRSLADLENMRIRTAAGLEVPFREVARAETGRGFATIQRADRRRSINVTASVDATKGSATEVIAELTATVLPEVQARHPGIFYSFEGQQAEQRDSIDGLKRGFALALLVIFALLAIPLRSYVQPLLIMLAIPFGVNGAIWGHVIMGLDLTVLSMFGLVALTGVVVNDSLVMVDFVNRKMKTQPDLSTAIRDAGAVRFRPILLTSLTTFGGLTPLLLERSLQAQFLIPMAVSLAFGVMFATVITLVLIPCSYLILEDLRGLVARRARRPGAPPAAVPAATEEGG